MRSIDLPRGTLDRDSAREMEVPRLLAHVISNKEIAEALLISPITARNHVDRLMSKLGVRSRLEAVVYASQKHLLKGWRRELYARL